MTDGVKHIVFYSGGVASWAAACRVVLMYGAENTVLLFTDTAMEDPDLYRFLEESAEQLGAGLVWLKDGRTPWDVFFDVDYLGNTRADPCSRILKRELARDWVHDNYTPENAVLYMGIDWTEEHRCKAITENWNPYQVRFPMCDRPLLTKGQMMDLLENKEGIARPALYHKGFPHNNCAGFCVKAGQAHFKLLLETSREQFLFHEGKEQELREHLGKDVSILRDRRGGTTKPLTLRQLRQRVEGDEQIDEHDWGGCGCFSDVEEKTA